MKSLVKTIVFSSAMVAMTAANAAILTTPPLNSHATQHAHCTLANVSAKPVQVINVEAIGTSSTVLGSSGEFTIQPGEIVNVIAIDSVDVFCRFNIKGSAKAVRAALNVEDAAGNQMIMVIPAT